MAVYRHAQQSAPVSCFPDTYRENLVSIRTIYLNALRLLNEHTAHTSRVRGQIINMVNPLIKDLPHGVLRAFLQEVSNRTSGHKMSPQALTSAAVKASLGTPGVLPEKYEDLVSHVRAMIFVLDGKLYKR